MFYICIFFCCWPKQRSPQAHTHTWSPRNKYETNDQSVQVLFHFGPFDDLNLWLRTRIRTLFHTVVLEILLLFVEMKYTLISSIWIPDFERKIVTFFVNIFFNHFFTSYLSNHYSIFFYKKNSEKYNPNTP